MEPMGQNQRQRDISASLPGGGTRAKLLSATAGLINSFITDYSVHTVVRAIRQVLFMFAQKASASITVYRNAGTVSIGLLKKLLIYI